MHFSIWSLRIWALASFVQAGPERPLPVVLDDSACPAVGSISGPYALRFMQARAAKQVPAGPRERSADQQTSTTKSDSSEVSANPSAMKDLPPAPSLTETNPAHSTAGTAPGVAMSETADVRKVTETEDAYSTVVNTDDLHMSEQQLYVQLQSAKEARRAVLASMQQWDERVMALEGQLSTLRDVWRSAAASKEKRMNARGIVLCSAIPVIAMFIVNTISKYEVDRDKLDPPWYLDGGCMLKTLTAFGLLWLDVGISCFTELLVFTEQARPLTVIESIYLIAQTVTTVGYGDLTPASNSSKLFMAFYALSGVALISAMLQQWVLAYMDNVYEESSEPVSLHVSLLVKVREFMNAGLSVVTCIGFGTLFFGLYQKEGKTMLEAFYMSVITLLTIGFGEDTPSTPVGQLVGAFWMIIGVACVGQALATMTDSLFKQRSSIRIKATALQLFNELDEDNSGTIDKHEFVRFELIRGGLAKHKFDNASAKFDNFDSDGNGTLDFEEFARYVAIEAQGADALAQQLAEEHNSSFQKSTSKSVSSAEALTKRPESRQLS